MDLSKKSKHAILTSDVTRKEHSAMKKFSVVIAGGGSGIPIYRRLQRKGIPFYTGVLHKNDVDYQVAKVLARETVAEEAFEPISEKQYAHALENFMKCRTVIAAVKEFGTMNEKNRILLEEAQKAGMEILDGDGEYWEKGSKGK